MIFFLCLSSGARVALRENLSDALATLRERRRIDPGATLSDTRGERVDGSGFTVVPSKDGPLATIGEALRAKGFALAHAR